MHRCPRPRRRSLVGKTMHALSAVRFCFFSRAHSYSYLTLPSYVPRGLARHHGRDSLAPHVLASRAYIGISSSSYRYILRSCACALSAFALLCEKRPLSLSLSLSPSLSPVCFACLFLALVSVQCVSLGVHVACRIESTILQKYTPLSRALSPPESSPSLR